MAAEYMLKEGNDERDALRARHPHVRDGLPVHARPAGGAGAPRAHRTCRWSSTRATPRAGATGCGRCRWRRRPRAPTGSSSRSTTIPSRRSATGRRRCRRTGSPSTPSRSGGSPRSPASSCRPSSRSRHRRMTHRGPRRRPDRRLDRAGRAAAARAPRSRLRPRACERATAALELGALDRAGGASPRRVDGAEVVFCARRSARCPSWSPRRSTASAEDGRRHRRRLDQARADRRARAEDERCGGSSAAIRWPAPRPPGSRTRAPTCSRARAGT